MQLISLRLWVFFFISTGLNENTTITTNSRLLNVFDVLLQLFFLKKKEKRKFLIFQRYLYNLTLNVMQKVEIPCLPNKEKRKKKKAGLHPGWIKCSEQRPPVWKFQFGTQFAHALVYLLP